MTEQIDPSADFLTGSDMVVALHSARSALKEIASPEKARECACGYVAEQGLEELDAILKTLSGVLVEREMDGANPLLLYLLQDAVPVGDGFVAYREADLRDLIRRARTPVDDSSLGG